MKKVLLIAGLLISSSMAQADTTFTGCTVGKLIIGGNPVVVAAYLTCATGSVQVASNNDQFINYLIQAKANKFSLDAYASNQIRITPVSGMFWNLNRMDIQ